MDSNYRFDNLRAGIQYAGRQLAKIAYTPTQFVKIGHSIPHVDPMTRQKTDGSFDTTYNYFLSVATTPIVLLVIGLVSCIIFALLLLTRCCFRCMSCAPNEDDYLKRPYNGDRLAWANKTVKTRRIVFGFFVTFLLFALAADHALHWGNAELDSGVAVAISALTTLSTFFSSLYTDTTSLSSGFSGMSTGFGSFSTNCTGNSAVSSAISSLSSSLNSGASSTSILAGLLEPLPTYLNLGKTYLSDYMIDYRSIIVYILYAFIAGNIFLYALVVYFRQARLMKLLLFLTYFIVFILTIICCIEMIFVIFLGDLCIDPITYILKPLPAGTVSDSVTYFTECEGTSPFASSTSGITSAVKTIFDLLTVETTVSGQGTSLATACKTAVDKTVRFGILNNLCGSCNGYFSGTGTGAGKAEYDYASGSTYSPSASIAGVNATTYSLIDTLFDCSPIQTTLTGIFEGSLCGGIYSGFFVIWITQFITSLCLYLTMCCGVVLYQYFDNKYWTLGIDGQYKGGEAFSPSNIEETAVVNVDSNAQHHGDALVYNAREVEMK